ncbi:hypothetical protein LguiB_012761 [Lonicera macranthoides]
MGSQFLEWSSTFLAIIWSKWKGMNGFVFNNTQLSSIGILRQAQFFAMDMKLRVSFMDVILIPLMAVGSDLCRVIIN